MVNKPAPDARRGEREAESVWDYPRPPRIEPTAAHLKIVTAGELLAETTRAFRILETSHPPVYYIPQADIAMQRLVRSGSRSSFCEFKGLADYWSLLIPRVTSPAVTVPDIAWSYGRPATAYAALKDHVAFYASRVDECWVDGERVVPQEGDFYGGWITRNLRGPFKGAPGTRGW